VVTVPARLLPETVLNCGVNDDDVFVIPKGIPPEVTPSDKRRGVEPVIS
jgi:hypothetical protein